MTFKLVLNTIISVFFVLGALDYIIGDKFKLGSEFATAFSFVGRIALSIVGMICLSPVIARILTPVVTPVYEWLHLDPGMFISLLLPPDSGGYSIAMDMCKSTAIGAWSGTVVAAHIGASFSFTIPTMLGVIDPKYHRVFSLGALSGLVACPAGCILGGLICGLPFVTIVCSLIPAILVSALIALGLMKKPDITIRAFHVFSRLLRVVIIIGLAAAGVQRLTGFVVIPGMKDISEGFLTAGTIGVSMAGILCMTKVLSVVLKKPLAALSRALKINDLAILGCFNSFCAAMPGGAVFGKMDPRGRVVFGSMAITSANVMGAHLSYIGANCPEMLMPMVVSKLFSGLVGVILAINFSDRILGKMPDPDALPEAE